jgi:hypothetical protein
VQNSDCVISSDSVDCEITESSEVQQLRVELYRVIGSDYRISNCDTADCSNCKIVNCVTVRASGINSLYPIRREVTCHVAYTQHVTICNRHILLSEFIAKANLYGSRFYIA